MRLVQDDAIAKRMIDEAISVCVADPFVGLVIVDKEVVVGAVIVNNYEVQGSVDISFAGRLSPATLRELARYLFDMLGVRRVQAVTRFNNVKARLGLERLGFKLEGFQRERFADCDGALYGLLRRDCKFRF